MKKLFNVYNGRPLTPEEEREMFVETFKYLDKKLENFLSSKYFEKLYEEDELIGAEVEDAGIKVAQMIDYCERYWLNNITTDGVINS